MTPRTFLISGLLAGLVAALATFFVAHQVGEPYVDAAIAVEDAHSAADTHPHTHTDEPAGHHDEGGTVVSRHNQSTWGLLTGTLAMSLAIGGVIALVAAGAVGRLGRLRPAQSTALVVLLGFVAVALVPFGKYPATPPAVGNPDTIGHRTELYFGYLAISVLAALAATVLANRLLPGLGSYRAVLIGIGGYLLVVVTAAELLPTVNEIGDFPADILWGFRRSSLTTLATMWGTIGVVLVGLVGRAADKAAEKTAVQNARRELAASL